MSVFGLAFGELVTVRFGSSPCIVCSRLPREPSGGVILLLIRKNCSAIPAGAVVLSRSSSHQPRVSGAVNRVSVRLPARWALFGTPVPPRWLNPWKNKSYVFYSAADASSCKALSMLELDAIGHPIGQADGKAGKKKGRAGAESTRRPQHLKGAFQMRRESTTESPTLERPEPAEVFRLLACAVEEHLCDKGVDEESIREIVAAEIGKATLPRRIEVQLPDGTVNALPEQPHRQFPDLLGLVEEGHTNLLMVGPAGSGKTTLARNLAEALGLDFGFISLSAGVTETHLMGRTLPQADGSWKFVPSRFVQIYTGGGVYLLDEIDAADANVMVAINAALANGVLVTPDGTVHHRHEKCLILAAANTWGRGGDLMYVGRNQLDASTLDRFCLATIFVTYDEDLEEQLARSGLDGDAADTLLAWVRSLRASISRNRFRRVASTRLVVSSIKALRKGRSLDVVKGRFFQDWSTDEKAKVCE